MKNIALVHDYLIQYGGAERVLEVLCDMFPDAPIYTLLYDKEATRGVFARRRIITSYLQKIPRATKYHRYLPLLMPIAIEQFDLRDYDIVISNSHSFAKGIITKPTKRHISYMSTPTRFLWDDSQRHVDEFTFPWPIKKILPSLLTYLRIWDEQAGQRPDQVIANSEYIKKRIAKYYRRDTEVIHPPVNIENFSISSDLGEYFLMVGRMVPYKRFDLGISVFNAIEKPLVIVGDGPEYERLRKIARPNIRFVGLVNDRQLAQLYRRCQALIFPQEEDFGIVPLEAMASGRPIIAYRAGGALETIVEGETGIFFDEQSEIDLAQAVGRYYQMQFDPKKIRMHAEKFGIENFKEKIRTAILRS